MLCFKAFAGSPGALFEVVLGAMFGRRAGIGFLQFLFVLHIFTVFAMFCYVLLCFYYVLLCFAMFSYVLLRFAMFLSCFAMFCYVYRAW